MHVNVNHRVRNRPECLEFVAYEPNDLDLNLYGGARVAVASYGPVHPRHKFLSVDCI